ncbi:hypothetical protein GC170_22130 [bacterium]|nr:hypothetical protein [bacterium]
MHSDIVVADITYPNPNVFYELGLRHACKGGTIIIRDLSGPRVPFDIAHLRHIEYENTPSGMKKLSDQFKSYLDHFARVPQAIDNQFQEIAKLTDFKFPDYSDPQNQIMPEVKAMMALMQAPEMLELFARSGRGEEVDQTEIFAMMAKYPQVAGQLLQALFQSGHISFEGNNASRERNLPTRGSSPNKPRKRRRN